MGFLNHYKPLESLYIHIYIYINHDKPLEYTLLLFNIAMENGPFIDDFPIKTSIYKGCSMAMLNNQRVNHDKPTFTSLPHLVTGISNKSGGSHRQLHAHFPLRVRRVAPAIFCVEKKMPFSAENGIQMMNLILFGYMYNKNHSNHHLN